MRLQSRHPIRLVIQEFLYNSTSQFWNGVHMAELHEIQKITLVKILCWFQLQELSWCQTYEQLPGLLVCQPWYHGPSEQVPSPVLNTWELNHAPSSNLIRQVITDKIIMELLQVGVTPLEKAGFKVLNIISNSSHVTWMWKKFNSIQKTSKINGKKKRSLSTLKWPLFLIKMISPAWKFILLSEIF